MNTCKSATNVSRQGEKNAKKIVSRVFGQQKTSYNDLDQQIQNLIKKRAYDKIGEVEFEQRIMNIKFEAGMRDKGSTIHLVGKDEFTLFL